MAADPAASDGSFFAVAKVTREGLVMMVVIKGENLTELYRALKTWKVDWIAEFNPKDYEAPTDDDAPFIKSITIHTNRPEKSPPADKRH